MVQLRLTQKVQKAAGLKPSDLSEITEDGPGLGSWTVNVFNQERRKVLVFINDRTLYSFVLYGVRKDHYKILKETFCNGLQRLLTIDGFTSKEQAQLMQGCEGISYTKTNSKKVLGNLNDLSWHYQYLISEGGGLEHADIGEIISKLNRMPQKNIDWGYSVDAVASLVAFKVP